MRVIWHAACDGTACGGMHACTRAHRRAVRRRACLHPITALTSLHARASQALLLRCACTLARPSACVSHRVLACLTHTSEYAPPSHTWQQHHCRTSSVLLPRSAPLARHLHQLSPRTNQLPLLYVLMPTAAHIIIVVQLMLVRVACVPCSNVHARPFFPGRPPAAPPRLRRHDVSRQVRTRTRDKENVTADQMRALHSSKCTRLLTTVYVLPARVRTCCHLRLR